VPLFLTDGFKDYATALLTHFGSWVQPPRRQVQGPTPKPRWMPLPALLYAQVVKQYRRRCVVRLRYRLVFGSLAGVKQVLAATGWQINTAFIERVHLTIRQHVAASGDVSPPSVKAKRVYTSSWPSTTRTITFACLTPAYAGRCRSPCRPTGRAQRDAGSPVRRPWPPG
jgi:hypothetical protein